AESVLDLKKIVQLRNRENELSPLGRAAHHVVELFDQSGQVEQARVPMVFIEPLQLAQLPAQELRSGTDQRADESEEGEPINPVKWLLHLAGGCIERHERTEK